MSGWDTTRRVYLAEPWQDFYVDLFEDPPMGAWLDLQEAANEAMKNPTPPVIEAAIRAFTPLIADHNLADREGKRIEELTLRSLSSGLFRAILGALERAMAGDGVPPTPARRERSRAPSSPGARRRRATTSGA